MFGSPALIDNLSRYGEKENIHIPSMKRVISAGAPARPDVLKRLQKMLGEGGEIHTPYGATESLPVSSIGSAEILSDTWQETVVGGGTCVGKPCNSVDVFIISITDDPIEKWSDSLSVGAGEKGEIVVRGPVVTKEYYNNPKQTALAKIKDEDGRIYHRMGDIGRCDDKGRLWFCGRKSHRLETSEGPMFTVPCEAVFNVHKKVFRSALVGLGTKGSEVPLLCVELEKNCCLSSSESHALIEELKGIAQSFEHTRGIGKFLIHPSFPVDVRHNAKINREILKVWAEEQVSAGAITD
jgi:acyl-CoA synthetase (AMP-forming)/AMP-acid ligase II